MDCCRAALLTSQGSEDRAVPQQQSRDVVAAARTAGCLSGIQRREGHGFRRADHINQGLQAELVFLGRVLGYTPAELLLALAIENAAALHRLGDATV